MDSDPTHAERIEAAAIRWLVRQNSGAWTEADQAQLDAWLDESTAHRIQYIRATAAWNQTARLRALGAGVPQGVIPVRASWGDARFLGALAPERQAPPVEPGAVDAIARSSEPGSISSPAQQPAHRNRLRFAAVAAFVTLSVALYLASSSWRVGDRYSTSVGGMEHVMLADGSKVTLNTATSLRVFFSEAERRIELRQGEAFFDVAKDESRPFVVYAGAKRVIAVGTRFSVRREGDDVHVVVTEGRVSLAAPPAGAGASVPRPTLLDAGAIARTSSSEVLVRHDGAVEAERLLSWRQGYLYFDDVALADAVAEFNRYTTRRIIIEDRAVAGLRIGGNFRSNNADAFLELLESGFPVIVEEEGERIVLKAR